MTPSYYRSPAKPISNRVRCPVCHEELYSLAGIHPQCAVRQNDPPRPKKSKEALVTEVIAVSLDEAALDHETVAPPEALTI